MGKGKSSRIYSQNYSNSNPNQSTGKRQYKGVRRRSWGSWVSEIRAPHQKTRIWLGSYSTPEAAARAYDAALLCLKGSSASFNFPTSLPTHLPDTVMSPKSIQRVAADAAAATADPTFPTAESPSPPPHSLDTNEESTVPSSTASMSGELDETWIELGAFQSLMCMDHVVNPVPYWHECEEMGDISLWSFFSECDGF